MAIPKIIHQLTKSKREMPEVFLRNMDKIKQMNPEWEHRLYENDEFFDFIYEHFDRDVLRSYCAINPRCGVVRADFFKYALMYKCGGVYLDSKSTCTRPLNDIIRPDDHYFLSHWRNSPGEPYEWWGIHEETPYPGEFLQWHMVASPGHPFLGAVVEKLRENIRKYDAARDGMDKMAVLRLTGPIAYTLAIRPLLGKAPARFVDSTELGFVYSFFDPDNKIFRETGEMVHVTQTPNHYLYSAEPLVLGM